LNRKLWLYVAVGILVGAAGVQGIHLIHDRTDDALFKQRLRCKALADKYVKDNTSSLNKVLINRVEFSRTRNSCIVATTEHFSAQPLEDAMVQKGLGTLGSSPAESTIIEIKDLLTGEELFTRTCTKFNECVLLGLQKSRKTHSTTFIERTAHNH
jgi:hypothetical protein